MPEVRILEQHESNEKPTSAKWLTCLIEAIILALAVILIAMVRFSWLEPASVTSGSMENTLKVGEKFLVDHRKSLSGTWKRGDIVLFETTKGDWGQDTLIKRVIGLPGETIAVVGGQVQIDGKPLKENYLKETPQEDDEAASLLLEKGQYYVMGDNRNNSSDSREYGPITNAEIRGRVTRKIWPMQAMPQPDYGD